VGRRRPASIVAALALAAILAGCSERPRLNPLDPGNVGTGGQIPGFNALAGDGQVELRWIRLTQQGVLGYSVERWWPGGTPEVLAESLPPGTSGLVDYDVQNDSTYVYRLLAHIESSTDATSPPDTSTPGARKIVVLSAGLPGLVGLTPDARDILYSERSSEAYGEIALDSVHVVNWLTLPEAGLVIRKGFDGLPAGSQLGVADPASVSVTALRGVGWVASAALQNVRSYGPSLDDPNPQVTISGVGRARVVRAGTADPSVWVGNEDGTVFRFTPAGTLLGRWSLGTPILAIALDEAEEKAWVAAGMNGVDNLYVIDGVDSTATLTRSGLPNVVDLAFAAPTRWLWISCRGTPRAANGLLIRADDAGVAEMTLSGIEPFGLTVGTGGTSCWVSELRSNQLVQIARDGTALVRSVSMDTPYRQSVLDPVSSP
jgi:hypothetical protein